MGGGVIDNQSSSSEDDEDSDNPDIYGFPLGFRPENVKCYKDTATTLCNGTRPGFTSGVVFDINKVGGVLTINRQLNVVLNAVGALMASDFKGPPAMMEVL